ncbi:hypothetical protein ACO1O0_004310 [Amphichorda felina]
MPGKDKKWGPSEERDLAMAVILAQQGEKVKYDWPRVHEYMTEWGYSFTRDAMSQHWTKRIMKDFKQRHGTALTKTSGSSGSASTTPTPSTNEGGGKAKKASKNDEEYDGEEAEELPPPTKKRKRAPKKEDGDCITVKQEGNPRGRERRQVKTSTID